MDERRDEGWVERYSPAECCRCTLEGCRQSDCGSQMQIVVAEPVPDFGVIGVGLRSALGGARQRGVGRVSTLQCIGSTHAGDENESRAPRQPVLIPGCEPSAAMDRLR